MIKKILNKIILKTIGGSVQLGNFFINVDRNQNLPSILRKYPDYGANLVRLAKVVATKYKPLKIFDVGGNIGDTIAMLLSDNPHYEIFSVEGDERYLKILFKNFGNNPFVHIYKNFLGEKDEVIFSSVSRAGGTLKINSKNEKKYSSIEIITIDSLISKNQESGDAKLIKIDTDGYDNQILRGSKRYLSTTKPIIYFEYDISFLKDNNEKGVDIFDYLSELGYQKLVFFDNYGRLLISTDVKEKRTINQLSRYVDGKNGAFAYYDVVVFHNKDLDIAESFIKTEEQRV